MSDWPMKYRYHELQRLFGDYKPTAHMPCFRCDEPEGMEIRFAFAKFAAAAHAQLPPGTMPRMDALFAPEPEPEPERNEPEHKYELRDGNLFMLRDYVISGETLVVAAIKAAGGARLLARGLGIPREAIERWNHIPAKRLQAVAKITGLPQHVLRPDLFDVAAPQFYCTEKEADEAWRLSNAQQLWLPLPYPSGFLPAGCCAHRPRLTLVKEQ